MEIDATFRQTIEQICSTPEGRELFYELLDNEIYRTMESDDEKPVRKYDPLVTLYLKLQEKDKDDEVCMIDDCFIALTGWRLSILIGNAYAAIKKEGY